MYWLMLPLNRQAPSAELLWAGTNMEILTSREDAPGLQHSSVKGHFVHHVDRIGKLLQGTAIRGHGIFLPFQGVPGPSALVEHLVGLSAKRALTACSRQPQLSMVRSCGPPGPRPQRSRKWYVVPQRARRGRRSYLGARASVEHPGSARLYNC
jgi:hypothetical protein